VAVGRGVISFNHSVSDRHDHPQCDHEPTGDRCHLGLRLLSRGENWKAPRTANANAAMMWRISGAVTQ
jgi:hypothetical protein